MLVSILMPVHGLAPYLEESIASILNQELSTWELILVLDRPTEKLIELTDQIVKKDNRIKRVLSPGTGIVDALNFGLNFASAELIARLDSDDLMEPERLSIQTKHFSRLPQLACVGSQMSFIDVNGNFFGATFYPLKPSQIKKHLRYQNCIGHPSVMYRKKNVLEIGGYRKALTGVEDYDLWLRLGRDSVIENLDQKLTRYRVSPGQYSKTFGNRYTILEEAARLDLVINFIDRIPADCQTIDLLESEISRIRRRNLLLNPVKIILNYQGYFVSRLIRILSSEDIKFLKFLKCIPFAVCLFFIAPNSIMGLIREKLKGRLFRIIGSGDIKFLKFLKCIPFAVCLFFIAPNSIMGLIREKLKGRK